MIHWLVPFWSEIISFYWIQLTDCSAQLCDCTHTLLFQNTVIVTRALSIFSVINTHVIMVHKPVFYIIWIRAPIYTENVNPNACDVCIKIEKIKYFSIVSTYDFQWNSINAKKKWHILITFFSNAAKSEQNSNNL